MVSAEEMAALEASSEATPPKTLRNRSIGTILMEHFFFIIWCRFLSSSFTFVANCKIIWPVMNEAEWAGNRKVTCSSEIYYF